MDLDMDGPISPAAAIETGPEVEDFANALDDCISPLLKPAEKRRRLLELPQKFYENATRRLSHINPRHARLGQQDVDMDGTDGDSVPEQEEPAEEAKHLEKEVQTWDLIRRLLPLRHASDGGEGSVRNAQSSESSPSRDLLQDFLKSDSLAQERRAVLQWLQTNAASRPDIDELVKELQQNADRGDIIAHGWLHTRSAIKLRKSVTSWPHLLDKQSPSIAQSHVNKDGAPLVMHLDPDAVTRQGRKLEPQDEYFERAIWLGCFEHLRRGSNLETIRDWCQDRTDLWRAISLSAMLLAIDGPEAESAIDASALVLWRRMCFSLARQGGSDEYEKAVYGVLSGDIPSVENVAKSWDDTLFANYNALLRTQFDHYLLGQLSPEVASNLTDTFPSFDATSYHGDPRTSDQRLIQSLASHPQLGKEAREPSKALQSAFISKTMQDYLSEQGSVIGKTADDQRLLTFSSALAQRTEIDPSAYFAVDDEDGLRVVTHVYVLTALLDRLETQGDLSAGLAASPAQENILAVYTDFLRRANLKELIPLYSSILPSPRRYEVLASNLIHETEPSMRRSQLRLMKKVGIDVVQYVRSQTQLCYGMLSPSELSTSHKRKLSIIQDAPRTTRMGRALKEDFFGQDEDDVDLAHQYMTRSLEWLMLIDETWPDVLAYGTKTYKYFLGNMHLTASRHLLQRVSFADVVKAIGLSLEELDENMLNDVNFWASQLEAHEIEDLEPQTVMMDARNFRELEALVRALDNLETMGSLVALSNEAPATNREYWAKVGTEIRATKDCMQPLLSEWLLTGIAAGDVELQRLRQMYLTETILAYVSALHFTGTALSRDHLMECMELASTIAEGESDLAASFVEAGRMKELLEAFAACSKALAVKASGRPSGAGSKKLQKMGWSKEIWSVQS